MFVTKPQALVAIRVHSHPHVAVYMVSAGATGISEVERTKVDSSSSL